MRLFFLLLIVSFFACRKSYQEAKFVVTDDPDNLTGQLVGTWKLYAQSSSPENDWNGDGVAETNMFGVLTDCQKEAGFSFGLYGRGLQKKSCAETTAVNWQIKNNSYDFVYNVESNGVFGPEKTAKIIQLNQRFFIISETVQAPNGMSYIINSRYYR